MYTPTPEILEEARVLGKLSLRAKAYYADQITLASKDPQDTAILHCLKRSTEIALGCCTAEVGCLPLVLAILDRVLIEELIAVQWICASKENADSFHKRGLSEMHKYIAINLERRFARITRKSTNEDETKKFLGRFKYSKLSHPTTENRAKEVGLHGLYTVMYTMFSNHVHGSDILLSSMSEDPVAETQKLASASYGLFLCVFQAVEHFLKTRSPITPSRIYSILKM